MGDRLYQHSNQPPSIPQFSSPVMAASALPVALGARGSVGSLVRKEIDYLSSLESEKRGSCQARRVNVAHGQSRPRHGLWFLTMTSKGKTRRRRGGSAGCGFLPSLCSMVKAVETRRVIPGYNNYMVLKHSDDLTQFDSSGSES